MMSLKEFLSEKNELFKKDYDRAPRYAKFVTHKITPYCVYYCVKWNLTPNQVTLFSYILGIMAAVFFSGTTPFLFFTAAVFLELYYVFDSVDGQLARYTKNFSKSGAFFDILGNYIVQPFLFIGIGIGQFRIHHAYIDLVLAFLAAMACVWLSQIWEIQARLAMDTLLKTGGKVRVQQADGRKPLDGMSPLKRAFVIAHKTCTFPTLMNITALTSLLTLITGNAGLFRFYILYYGFVLPGIAVVKISKIILHGEVDRYCESVIDGDE